MRWKIAQTFEIRWWQRYLKNKDKGDYLKWKREYWHQFLEKNQIILDKNQSVLDAGCGPAGVFTILNQQEVVAVDPLLNQYDEKLAHFDKAAYPNVSFINSPLETFEHDQQFDTLFCINAINHVKDLAACFDKLVALTKPGGQMIVSIDAHNISTAKTIFRLIPGDILHPHQYDLEEYEAMLTDRGCTIERVNLYKKERLFNYYVLVCRKEK